MKGLNRMNKKTKISTVLVLLLALTALCVSADSTYSSVDDPLVSLSYVNDVLGPQIAENILKQINNKYAKAEDINSLPQFGYTYLTLNGGQTLTAGGICEVVILEGNASALVTSAANISAGRGLSDLTDGKVIANGENILPNHQIVIPKNDGRGFVALSDTLIILIRGEYNIAG